MNTVQKITAAHFVANPQLIEALAHEWYAGTAAVRALDGTYLRVLIVGVQAEIGPKTRRRPDVQSQVEAIEKVNETFYAAVLRGVTTPEIAHAEGLDPVESTRRSIERNRRSTFARSAKSTLIAYVKAGGDLRTLAVAETTKTILRNFVNQTTDAQARDEATVLRAQTTIVRVVAREAGEDVDAARTRLEAVIAKLTEALEGLGTEHGSTTTLLASRGHTRGSVHQAPAQHMRGA